MLEMECLEKTQNIGVYMSKDKKNDQHAPVTEALVAVPTPVVEAVPAANTKMAEEDRWVLELAKSRKETALAQAKEALAKNETAELAYKYVVLQLYMKYGLTAADAISENGDIVKGG